MAVADGRVLSNYALINRKSEGWTRKGLHSGFEKGDGIAFEHGVPKKQCRKGPERRISQTES